jgi:CheY-like chemotaxis protein
VDLRVGRYARLSVADDGAGMDAATQQRIFEPFFTTKAAGVGTGLGLSTVHGIAKSHEGAISVYSRLGDGTTFHLFLPAVAFDDVQNVVTGTSIPRGRGEHVLLVDDEQPLALWGRQALERLGYRVTAETDPRRAFGVIAADPAQFDLLVLDYAMPAMNGFQLAERVRSMRPSLPIVMTTGFPPERDPASVGIQELVIKPSTIQTLGEAVHRALVAVY